MVVFVCSIAASASWAVAPVTSWYNALDSGNVAVEPSTAGYSSGFIFGADISSTAFSGSSVTGSVAGVSALLEVGAEVIVVGDSCSLAII